MIPSRHEPDQTTLGGAGPAVVVAGDPARPVCRFRHPPDPAVNLAVELYPSSKEH